MVEYAVGYGNTPGAQRTDMVLKHWERQQCEIATRTTAMLRSASKPGNRIDQTERRAIGKLEKESARTRQILDGWEAARNRQRPVTTDRPITRPPTMRTD